MKLFFPFLILATLFSLNSCKEEAILETKDFIGTLKGVVTVLDRLEVGNKNARFNTYLYGKYVDTTNQYCCSLGRNEECPRVYDLKRIEIFKHDGEHFIWNDKIYYQDTIPRSNDFPLKLRNDSLVFDYARDKVITNTFSYSKFDWSYPGTFSLLYWGVSLKKESYGKGKLVYHRKEERSSSGGAYGRCNTMEISTFQLTSRPQW